MKITIESTDVITTHNGARVRVWKGVTELGVKCGVFVAGLAVHEDESVAQFEQELVPTQPPRELTTREVFNMRMF